MTTVQNFLARLLTITVMVSCVLILMNLTGSNRESTDGIDAAKDAHATMPVTRAERIESMAKTWDVGVDFSMPYAALTPLTPTDTENLDIRFNPADDYWGLPRSDGVETVAGLCGACHSLAIVMQQRQSKDGWNYLFDWMIEKQGMAPITGSTRNEIITYLSREFGQE